MAGQDPRNILPVTVIPVVESKSKKRTYKAAIPEIRPEKISEAPKKKNINL